MEYHCFIEKAEKVNLPMDVACIADSLNPRRTTSSLSCLSGSRVTGASAMKAYTNTIERNFFEEPVGIVAHRRHKIRCQMFCFRHRPQPKGDRKVRFSKLTWASV